MKLFFFLLTLLFLLLSCGNEKHATSKNEVNTKNEQSIETVEETAEKIRIVGTVRTAETGCKLYIDAKENDGTLFKLYPENLDLRFHKEGMFLKFYYTKTGNNSPTDCEVDMSATLSDVTPLRR